MKKRNYYSIKLNNIISYELISTLMLTRMRLFLIQVIGYVALQIFPDLPEHLTPVLKKKGKRKKQEESK